MRRIWNPKRDGNYYAGLFLLIVASLSLVWAIWQEAFDPRDFLVYFLIYGWGYILLIKSDTEFRLRRLEEELTKVSADLENLDKKLTGEERYFSGITNKDFSQQPPPAAGELFQELWGESSDKEPSLPAQEGKPDKLD